MVEGIKKIGVIGAGQMGTGIAQVSAMSGFETLLWDVEASSIDKSFGFMQKHLQRGLEKNKWENEFIEKTMNSLSKADSLNDFNDCDLVIEAIVENESIKFELFSSLDKICKPSCLLASNTSSIPISKIAESTNRADKVAGMHFMNPVPVMKLVEGIRGKQTSEKSFELIESVAKKMGKTFVKSNDFPGFIVNRVLMPMINEAIYALDEGVATAEDIDEAMKLGTNQPMGPLVLADFIGLDTCLAIMNVLYEGFKTEKYKPCSLLETYVSDGKLGKKTKEGFYKY